MSLFLVSPTPSKLPGTGAASGPASASAFSADGGDAIEGGAQGLPFAALLARQIKGLAALFEGRADGSKSSRAPGDNDQGEDVPVTGNAASAPALPLDLSALQASALVLPPALPFAPKAPGAEEAAGLSEKKRGAEEAAGLPAKKGGVAEAALDLAAAGKAKAAEIAEASQNLPPAIPPGNRFSEKLAALTDGVPAAAVAGKADAPAVLPDPLPGAPLAVVGPADVSAALRRPEPVPAQHVLPRVGSAEWGGAVGDKVLWMAGQSRQVAELHLNPPSLGPLEVRLTVSNDQASALFVSHHAAVREAIETALPRLREMLADSGIMLGNVSVGAESFSQQQQAFDRKGSGREDGGNGPPATDRFASRAADKPLAAGLAHDGMVDIFA
ncbi:MAG: flagellar hook-length control protein FliK [Sulfuricella sp.]|nr:flagellar hook-length control protein FliK [Sulfuricella sp.]